MSCPISQAAGRFGTAVQACATLADPHAAGAGQTCQLTVQQWTHARCAQCALEHVETSRIKNAHPNARHQPVRGHARQTHTLHAHLVNPLAQLLGVNCCAVLHQHHVVLRHSGITATLQLCWQPRVLHYHGFAQVVNRIGADALRAERQRLVIVGSCDPCQAEL